MIFYRGLHGKKISAIFGQSNSNLDCRYGFLGVDYIGLDTSYDNIEDLTQNVRGGGQPPAWGGVRPPIFY